MMKSYKRNHLTHNHNPDSKENYLNLRCRQSLKQMATQNHVTILSEDDTSVAAFIIGFVAENIIHQRQWQIGNLTARQRKAIWIVILAMTEHLSWSLDVMDEQVAEYAAMWIFRHDNNYIFGSKMREMKQEYHGLKTGTSRRALLALLNRSITALLSDGEIMHTKNIARITSMLAGASETLLHVH